jgi:glycosyltransferase involved in cell wall biosynthesis
MALPVASRETRPRAAEKLRKKLQIGKTLWNIAASMPTQSVSVIELQSAEVTVVAVCRREGPALEAAIEGARSMLAGVGRRWRFVFVDDGTDDGTFGRLLDAARGEPRIGVLRQANRLGFGSALRGGIARSTTPIVCATDVDGGFSAETLADLVRCVEEGADLAMAAPLATPGNPTGEPDGSACAMRADRGDILRGARFLLKSRTALAEMALRARRAGWVVSILGPGAASASFPAIDSPAATKLAIVGDQLRKIGMALMFRGRSPRSSRQAA